MAKKIVFLDRESLDATLKPFSFENDYVEHESTWTPEDTVARLKGAEIALINKVPMRAEVLKQLPDLKLIAVAATGTDVVDKAQAKAQGFKVKVGKFPFVGNSKATILDKHEGFVKVIAEETLGEILGVHIIGPEAFELIAEAVTAMEAEATVESMMATIHAHPTIYEAIGEAFNNVYGLAINI